MAGEIKPAPACDWTEEERARARANCAARQRERGNEALALAYEHGACDAGWNMVHEVNRLRAEAGAA